MQLPDVLEPRDAMQRLIGGARPTLLHAVVHDGNPWPECREHAQVPLVTTAMMRNEIDVHGPDQVVWTSQGVERRAGQVPVSISNEWRSGVTTSVDCPPSTSMK